ncbi:YihY/virulence factor BrkB family protein [uncultured Georgenia sp.]|uniref:YihY/virulence factor BrkB family protein n=1 Tax=uncultured Georgenia sp. TaxID=378209 RepID=UPI0026182DF8|nr:YihY/virulence factor BrkB family protein [uncultured Georgenia sp.]
MARERALGVPGARADAPHQIPWRGWVQIVRRVAARVVADRFAALSAGVAFFAVLSIAPVLLAALSVYGAVNSPEQARDHLAGVVGVLPPALGEVLRDQLVTVTEASTQLLTSRGMLALAVALGTATTAAAFLIDALTLAYREAETRPLLHRTGLALAFVLGGAVVVGTVIAGTAQVSRALAGAPGWLRTLALAAAWVVLAALMALALAVLYRFAPDRHGRAKWRWVSGGAAVTTLLWLAVSAGLFAYVQRLGTYERMYGSLAGVAISMLWLWLTVLLVVLGAAVNAEAERQTTRDSTVGAERPPGERGAVVADDVPPHPAGPPPG